MRAWVGGAYISDGYEWDLTDGGRLGDAAEVEVSEEEYADYERACDAYYSWQKRLYDMHSEATRPKVSDL